MIIAGLSTIEPPLAANASRKATHQFVKPMIELVEPRGVEPLTS
jgi:hypothetical protein